MECSERYRLQIWLLWQPKDEGSLCEPWRVLLLFLRWVLIDLRYVPQQCSQILLWRMWEKLKKSEKCCWALLAFIQHSFSIQSTKLVMLVMLVINHRPAFIYLYVFFIKHIEKEWVCSFRIAFLNVFKVKRNIDEWIKKCTWVRVAHKHVKCFLV